MQTRKNQSKQERVFQTHVKILRYCYFERPIAKKFFYPFLSLRTLSNFKPNYLVPTSKKNLVIAWKQKGVFLPKMKEVPKNSCLSPKSDTIEETT